MNVLAIDVGGTHIKFKMTGNDQKRKFPSGPEMTATQMVEGVKRMTGDWSFGAASIGFPGPVVRGRPVAEPENLGTGWLGFDFEQALGVPVKLINDAAMQALGSYEGGKMLFLGLGTGLGSAMIVDGVLEPMEIGHLPYRKRTFEGYVGTAGLLRSGKKKWRVYVADVIERFTTALQPEYIILGGGNAELIKELPANCRLGNNANAFVGGFRLWQPDAANQPIAAAATG
jgi:polyphosphate glucokinase